ncbi:MAG: hypothetical protein AVDCRST_MAG42-1155 [uncultured Chthoniobacterales bacterium]|uniref:Uncharacterized protein n=1 Tax=uncultured Chthoniobacterales bacterium TaxID=1836801 RepID=A0A6J4HUL2_9BACT|nr:MAG: hypothetical protein AVDCRST_MAG42-1155 [uncultured Chthoniobacterales bacterium]
MVARQLIIAAASAVVCALPAVAAADVRTVSVPASTTLYFHMESHSHAEYFEFRKDGRYRQIDVQHLMTEEWDSGRWEARGEDIILRSSRRPVDIVTREFRIYVRDRADLRRLRHLRQKLAAFLQLNGGRTIPFATIKTIAVHLPNSRRKLDISLDVHFELDAKRPEVERGALEVLLRRIDDYLRNPDVFTHSFRLRRYRGVEWLEPVGPNDVAPSPVADLVKRIDQSGGKQPDYVFVRVSQRQFAAGAGSLYPFKFYPAMNEKVKAQEPKR